MGDTMSDGGGARNGPALGLGLVVALAGVLTGCELLGAVGPPTVYVTAPENFSILADTPPEIRGVALGQVDEVTLTVDGQPAGRPQAGERGSEWFLPLARPLADGIHRARAVASGPAGTSADSVIFAIGSLPFTIGFVPERLVVDRAQVRDEPWPAFLGLIGPPFEDDYFVQLALEDAGGLAFEVFPFTALEATAGFPNQEIEPVSTGQWVFIDITIPPDMPLGERQLVVRADGPPGTEPQRATLVVEVVDGSAPPTQEPAAPVAPGAHVETYRVRSRVTQTDTPGLGNRATATWRLAFVCPDGRCDAEVRNGGPRGQLEPFVATWVAAEEVYLFEATETLVGESCSEVRLTGRIEPDTWDARGPVRFRYRLDGVTRCSRADLHVTWEGTGRRR
jgi:hypothetical protein